MRPAIPKGEVFAVVNQTGPDAVGCRFYQVDKLTSPGRPLIDAVLLEAHRLPPPVLIAEQQASPPIPVANHDRVGHHTPREGQDDGQAVGAVEEEVNSQQVVIPATSSSDGGGDEGSPFIILRRTSREPEAVLAVTAIAFFGIRVEADGSILLSKEEEDAAHSLAEFGHFPGDLPCLRTKPIGKKTTLARARGIGVPGGVGGRPNEPTASPAPASRVMKREDHFKHQLKALVKKDFIIMKASKCAMCGELCIALMMIFAMSMILLFSVAARVNSSELEPFTLTGQLQPSQCYVETGVPSVVGEFCHVLPDSAAVNFAMTEFATSYFNGSSINGNDGHNGTQWNVAAVGGTFPEPTAFNLSFFRADVVQSAIGAQIAFLNASGSPGYVPPPTAISAMKLKDEPSGNQFVGAASTGAIFVIIGLIPAAIRVATRLVDEQREGFREHLRVMGCGDGVYLLSIYLSGIIRTLPVVLLVTLLCRVIWWKGLDVFMIYVIVQFYFMSMLSLSTLMPAIFTSSTWAMVVMMFFSLFSCIAAPVITGIPDEAQIFLVCFFPTVTTYYGLTHALAAKYTYFVVPYGWCVGILFIQFVFFALLAYYLNRVFPGQYGTPAHPCFMLQQRKDAASINAAGLAAKSSTDHFVVMKNLRKFFGSRAETPAVNLSLSIRHGEILALLGHNGAGKTTTINMLSGLMEASDYDVATVGGLDISQEMNTIRLNIGVCPQHDVLFPYLSARQHLELFANLRGVNITDNRLDELLMFLELPLDTTLIQEFSGGMKRRVSVAMAIVGEPAIVFLDEPTTALDEVSRQKLWELLRVERSKGLTMVLTTHQMEEAEKLGDRIAIMSYGELHSEGTAMELKSRYGTGHYLEFAKGPNFSLERAASIIQRACPEASLHLDSGVEATFFIPATAQEQYAEILEEVENEISEIGASSYGFNMSTLEDVFVSIAETAHDSDMAEAETVVVETATRLRNTAEAEVFGLVDAVPLWRKVLADSKAIFMKRVRSTAYLKFELVLQVVVPILIVVAAFASIYSFKFDDDDDNQVSIFTDGEFPGISGEQLYVPIIDNSKFNSALPSVEALAGSVSIAVAAKFPTVPVKVLVLDKAAEWNMKLFIPATETSFIRMSPSVVPMAIVVNQLDPTGILLEVGYSEKFAQVFSGTVAAMVARSAALVANNTPAFPTPAILPIVETSVFHFIPNTTAVPPPPENNSTSETGKYMWIAALLLILGVLFQNFPVLIVLNDELGRGVRDTMLAHGTTNAGYWIGNFFYDFGMTLLFPIGVVIGVHVRDIEQFTSSKQSAGLFFFTTMYCATMVLITYLFLVWKPLWKLSGHITAAIGFFWFSFLLPVIVIEPMRGSGLVLEHPGYPMLEAIFPTFSYFTIFNYKRDFSRMEDRAGGTQLVVMCVYPLIPMMLMYAILTRRKFTNNFTPANEGIPLAMFSDEDIFQEMKRIDSECVSAQQQQQQASSPTVPRDMISGCHIWKKYDDGVVAVKGVTFGVHGGECFGLLGTNGAGKTSIMRMLQQEVDPSGGGVVYGTLPPAFSRGLESARQHLRMGICQQHDTLVAPLTGEEHMHLFLQFRLGPLYRKKEWSDFVRDVLVMMQLPLTKPVKEYSGGMKRKLAVALAVFTGARIMFLDEPSTGLDPFARRLLWRVINAALARDNCVMLTTHSMEEADAVCGRIAIVADGTMKCIGSSQHLKQRYGSGYVVSLILTPASDPAVVDRGMIDKFGDNCRPTFTGGSLRQYNVGDVPSLSATYRTLQQCGTVWFLERYSISQCNLHQVFVAFAENIH